MEKFLDMRFGVLYALAAVFFVIWFVGFMAFDKDGFYHLFFLISVITVIFTIFKQFTTRK